MNTSNARHLPKQMATPESIYGLVNINRVDGVNGFSTVGDLAHFMFATFSELVNKGG